jgi:hypothetical protein
MPKERSPNRPMSQPRVASFAGASPSRSFSTTEVGARGVDSLGTPAESVTLLSRCYWRAATPAFAERQRTPRNPLPPRGR